MEVIGFTVAALSIAHFIKRLIVAAEEAPRIETKIAKALLPFQTCLTVVRATLAALDRNLNQAKYHGGEGIPPWLLSSTC